MKTRLIITVDDDTIDFKLHDAGGTEISWKDLPKLQQIHVLRGAIRFYDLHEHFLKEK
jgi:hypothetical protein